ncbi:ABC transporter permease [Candidatus Acetatifactor stercoripullorum]|nr:ABC transporter permease [Candidatus Acetatifactor stercoripullorum]
MANSEKNKKSAVAENGLLKKVGTQKLIALLALIVLYVVFGMINRSFWSYSTLINIFEASYYIGLMAIGVTFAITSDGIDLSIGTVMMCSSLMAGALVTKYNVPVVIALVVCILIGTLFGLVNGVLVSYMKLPPFIATLGTMMFSKGVGSVFTRAQSITWPQAGTENGWFRNIFKMNINGVIIPTGFILLIVIAVLAAILLNKTRPGRYIVSLGSNYEATRLSGVDVAKYRTLAYVLSGMLSGVAGLAYAAIYSTILPGGGGGMELDAIAGVVIGGTSMSGGFGTISGTLIGVFIMSVLKTGLPFIGLQTHYQQIATGIVLVFAVFIDVWNRNKKKRV